jgi:2-polyprenyl-3-methyl-5-hydroxy-6-metoxy-1,4-benzoquinol methylase
MRYHPEITVLSNIQKGLPPDVKLVLGNPNGNPMALPFRHKQIFAEQLENYDLFVYTEDDILIREQNIDSFLRATEILAPNEIAGFLRVERTPGGAVSFPDVFNCLRWDPNSVRRRGPSVFGYFSNEHSGCYLLTQQQLRQCIHSGGYDVGPHENTRSYYELLESAATDPYTQCGLKKLICLSEPDNFLVEHLSGKYAGKIGVEKPEVDLQCVALLEILNHTRPACSLANPQTTTFHLRWSKSYYEPCRHELLDLIPSDAESVLSIGVGWGATEEALVSKGVRVVGIPMDSVIAACAQARGVEIVYGNVETAKAKLAGEQFDCILLSNILHLLDDPAHVLLSFADLVAKHGAVVASFPNFPRFAHQYRRLRHYPRFEGLANYAKSGIYLTNKSRVSKWFRRCGLRVSEVNYRWPRNSLARRLFRGSVRSYISDEIFIKGVKN